MANGIASDLSSLVMPDSLDATSYRLRANAFVGERTYRLTDDALTWEEEGKPLNGVFFDQIATVRLSFSPTRVATRRFRTRVFPKAGGMTEFFNLSYRGFADFADQSAEYTAFVRELHRRLAAKGKDAAFHAGQSTLAFIRDLLISAFIFVGLAAVVLLLPISALPGVVIVKLVVIAAFAPTLVRYLRRAKPTRYDPLDIPAALLP